MISKSTTNEIARAARRQIQLEIEHQERIGDPNELADELRKALELEDAEVLAWASVVMKGEAAEKTKAESDLGGLASREADLLAMDPEVGAEWAKPSSRHFDDKDKP